MTEAEILRAVDVLIDRIHDSQAKAARLGEDGKPDSYLYGALQVQVEFLVDRIAGFDQAQRVRKAFGGEQ